MLYVTVPSKAPVLKPVTVLNSTSVKVEWQPVPEDSRHGIITKYVISYKAENKTGKKEVSESLLKAVVNGLSQSTKYSFRVRAETVKGAGPESNPKHATTEGKEIKIIISLFSYEINWFYIIKWVDDLNWPSKRDSKAGVKKRYPFVG